MYKVLERGGSRGGSMAVALKVRERSRCRKCIIFRKTLGLTMHYQRGGVMQWTPSVKA